MFLCGTSQMKGEVPQYIKEMFQEKSTNGNEPQLRSTSGQTCIAPSPKKKF